MVGILAGTTAGVSACGGGQPEAAQPAAPSAQAGTAAPDFTAVGVDGKTFRLSDHLGKSVVLLDFLVDVLRAVQGRVPASRGPVR